MKNEKRDNGIFSMYKSQKIKNKTAIARKFGVISRTVGRVIDAALLNSEYQEKQLELDLEQTTENKVKEEYSDFKYLITSNTVMISIGDEIHAVDKSHENFEEIVDAIKSNDVDKAIELSDIAKAVGRYVSGDIEIDNNQVMYKGVSYSNDLTIRILDQMQAGVKPDILVNFMNNVMQNPSYQSANELFKFLKACSLPLTEDGFFLAYKRVNSDYTDCHTSTIDNSVGQVVKMERNQVNDNRNETCSSGLHFCSKSYLGHFGGSNVMVLKINPKDVVSIPSDYNDAKGRCCEYEVIGQIDDDVDIPDWHVTQEWIDSLNSD